MQSDFPLFEDDEPKNIDFYRLISKFERFWKRITKIPNFILQICQFLIKICSSPSEFAIFLQELWKRFQRFPIVVFYSYLWNTSKTQLFMNLFVNYLFPMLLEALPWYFSQRKLGRELRTIQNNIHHRMLKGKPLLMEHAIKYLSMTVMHAFLQTLDQHLKSRVDAMNKFIIKRLLLERLVYSEIWALEFFQNTSLERRMWYDMSSTLRLCNYTIPNIVSNLYAIVVETKDLIKRRNQIDIVALCRPFVSVATWEFIDWIKVTVMGRQQRPFIIQNSKMNELFNTVTAGITDIQLNNLQLEQLNSFDRIVNEDFSGLEDIRFFLNRMYSRFTSRSVFDSLFDAWVTSYVMQKRKMTHEEYKKIQLDITHLYRLMQRTYNYINSAVNVLDNTTRIIDLMNMPNFQDESNLKKVYNFSEIIIKDIVFSYSQKNEPPYALNFEGEIHLQPNKIYAIIGQNRSGKSTLTHLICKLHQPQLGTITLDGIDYKTIQRNSLRNLISYLAQKPFIFPGTIKENILVGNPNASEQAVIQAATKAGIFTFEEYLQGEENLTLEKKRKILNMKTVARGVNLSGGFQQSVALARAFLKTHARLMILDESMSALDPIKKRNIFPHLIQFAKENKIALIIISHDMNDVKLADHIIFLEAGKIVCQGSHEELIKNNKKYKQMFE